MKKIFQIKEERSGDLIQPMLQIRAGENHFSAAITDHASGELERLVYYLDPEGISVGALREVIDQEIAAAISFYQVIICYDFPGHALVPSNGFRQEEASLFQPAATPASVVITESIPEWQLYNVYPVPVELHQYFNSRFPTAQYRNQFTAGLKKLELSSREGSLLIDIRHHDFSVMAAKAGKLLLAQTYEYSVPDDIIYYLLRICRQFELSQQEVVLNLSGLIDQDSALYKELFQYFIHLGFRDSSWKGLGRDFPAHFFTSLNDIEQCVS